ncbi:MAG: hypothetical protein FK733_09275 [Asgard group archaeon]|nr:hypothetical protein [Asgard group archaeon]
MKLKQFGLILIPLMIVSQFAVGDSIKPVDDKLTTSTVEVIEDIVYYWAPVWYQDTDSSSYISDFITSFDYDGNWVGNDNWDNMYSYPLNATIYYSIVETDTHWFIGYYDFHPRDWHETGLLQHENDMEGALIVIKKDGSTWGQFYCMVTEAHGEFYQYTDAETPCSANITDNHDDIDGDVEFETVNQYYESFSFGAHEHPIVYAEAKGHAVYGDKRWEDGDFPGGDGVIYKPMGRSHEPTLGNDRNVSYALTSIDVLWEKRFGPYGDGKTFASFSHFDGNDYGEDKASPPWGWDDKTGLTGLGDGPTYAGEIFYNPADLVATHFSNLGNFNHTYTRNPYALELRIDQFMVNWDLDDTSDSDGYFNLFLFHSDGEHTPGDGVLDGNDGSQISWVGEDMEVGVWLDMHQEINRPFYGVLYPNRPYFGINCKEWDEFSSDPWLMNKKKTHWYGHAGTPNYDRQKVNAIDLGQQYYDWEGSEVYITVNVTLGNFSAELTALPSVAYLIPAITVISMFIIMVRKRKSSG